MDFLKMKETFEKAGFCPLPVLKKELSPEEEKRSREMSKAVNDYLSKITQAHKASKHSKLRFCQKIKICTHKGFYASYSDHQIQR